MFSVLCVHVCHLLRADDWRNSDVRDVTFGELTVDVSSILQNTTCLGMEHVVQARKGTYNAYYAYNALNLSSHQARRVT